MEPELPDDLLARPFAAVREACAEVAARARFVTVDSGGLERFADAIPRGELGGNPTALPALANDAEGLAAFVLTLDSLNFGSGWFPLLRKPAGHSGYRTVESQLRARFEASGPIAASALRAIDARAVAELLGQSLEGPVAELMELYARALRELGELVQRRTGGSFAGFVEEAGGSAAALVRSLVALPLWRDVARHEQQLVPFFKRAQITVSDLAHALPDDLGRFRDLDELTLFADNLVPHVLRLDGVLRFAAELVARIEREELLSAGSPEEVEIRACAVDAVEQISARMSERGAPVSARALDEWLWRRGAGARYKARPRHRARCSYY